MQLSYNDIIKKEKEIKERLGNIIHYQAGRSVDFAKDKSIAHFGSGNIVSPNHVLYKNISKKIVSIDSDEKSKADFKKLSEVKEKFEVVIAEHVFEHIPFNEISGVFKEIYRILEDDGEFLMTIPNIKNFGSWFSNYEHVNYAPHAHIAAVAEITGLNAINRFGWSKQARIINHSKFTETEKFLASFLQENYGLELYTYVTYIFKKEKQNEKF